MKSIYVIDDHPMMREGISSLIADNSEWNMCGTADTSARAVEEIPAVKPDLVITDISLPDRNGLELIKDLRSLLPGIQILVFSMHDEILYAERAMRAGAKGYVMKGEAPEVFLKAMGEVLSGGVYLSKKASNQLLKNLGEGKSRGVFGLDRLTDRELEIFELIGRGISNSQISGQLNISPKTVDAHRMKIKSKLGLPDAPSLMRAAVLWIEQARTAGSVPPP